jgi:hypothetical protein
MSAWSRDRASQPASPTASGYLRLRTPQSVTDTDA